MLSAWATFDAYRQASRGSQRPAPQEESQALLAAAPHVSAFVAKLSDAEGEAAETQTWIEFSVKCGYLDRDVAKDLYLNYDEILAMIVSMINNTQRWVLPSGQKARKD